MIHWGLHQNFRRNTIHSNSCLSSALYRLSVISNHQSQCVERELNKLVKHNRSIVEPLVDYIADSNAIPRKGSFPNNDSPVNITKSKSTKSADDMDLDELRAHFEVVVKTYDKVLINNDRAITSLQESYHDLKLQNILLSKERSRRHQPTIQSTSELMRIATRTMAGLSKDKIDADSVTKKMQRAFEEWHGNSFQEGELCDNLQSAASELQTYISEDVKRMRNDDALVEQCRDAMEAGCESFKAIYRCHWSNVEVSEKVGIEKNVDANGAVQKAIEDSKKAGYQPKQNCENFLQLYQSYAITVEKFDSEMENIAENFPGISWKRSPPKKSFRFTDCRISRNAASYAKCLNIGKGSFEASSMDAVCDVKMAILNLAATRPDIWIIRLQEGFTSPWRDDLMNVIILCDDVYHIYEIQFCHLTMLNARKPVAQVLMSVLQRNSLSVAKLNPTKCERTKDEI